MVDTGAVKKSRMVAGVTLASGFWWLVMDKGTSEYTVLRNKRDQMIILPKKIYDKLPKITKRIKL